MAQSELSFLGCLTIAPKLVWSSAGLVRHFGAVLDEGPAIIYNVPGRCEPVHAMDDEALYGCAMSYGPQCLV